MASVSSPTTGNRRDPVASLPCRPRLHESTYGSTTSTQPSHRSIDSIPFVSSHHPKHSISGTITVLQMAVHFLLLFLLPSTALAAFSPPFATFLACGAGSDVPFLSDSPQRTFTPDDASLSGSSRRHTTAVRDSDPNPPSPLYAAARAATRGFSYRLSAAPSDKATVLVLRLHFFPFTSQSADLSSSRFNVSALARYLLLSSFSPPRAGVVREFFLPSDGSGGLDVAFTPEVGFAFVNAIELFPAPPELLWNHSEPTMVNAVTLLPRQALETLYRLNVGGPTVTTENDTMWRTWLPDGPYLSPATDSAVDRTQSGINFDEARGWTRMIAPDVVYKTQRTTANSSTPSNVTWTFAVDGERSYLVRLHFCAYDVLSSVVGAGLDFNVYLMQAVGTLGLTPKDYASRDMPTQAFYVDYVITVPTGGQNLTVSIGRSASNDSNKAILNGLEIMKLRTVDMNPASSPSDRMKKVVIPVVAAVLGVAVLAGILLCVFFVRRRQRQAPQPAPDYEKESVETPWSPYTPNGEGSVDGSLTARRVNMKLHIPLAEIMEATGGFHDANLIGVGGFGNVYRGVLRDGTRVAVKRGKRASRQGFPEFQTEILVLTSIRHRHLVSLIGYCNERSEMILVYEHMEKGTLRSHLYGSDVAPAPLSWKQRLEICIGAARGLHYLHTGHSDNIIHRDVKSTNILLSDGLVAKVADFGLSRIGPALGQTHVSTAVKGSFGYLDPEYFKTRQLTDRSDVYSFGVVLFEVLSARPVIDQSLPPDEINLAEWAMHWSRRGRLDRVVDPRIAGDANENSLRKLAETAERCLADYGEDRPSMGDVVWNLEYCLQLQESQTRSETFEDSGTQLPGDIVTRRVPFAPIGDVETHDGADSSWSETSRLTATGNVFSQIMTGDGR